MSDPNIAFYGFTPVPRDPGVLFANHPTASGDCPKQDYFQAEDFPIPESVLVNDVTTFVKVSGISEILSVSRLLVYVLPISTLILPRSISLL